LDVGGRIAADLLYIVDACDETDFAANMALPIDARQPLRPW
jgi:hypothetical protein